MGIDVVSLSPPTWPSFSKVSRCYASMRWSIGKSGMLQILAWTLCLLLFQYQQKKNPGYQDMKEDTVWSMDRFNDHVNSLAKEKGLPRDWVHNQFTVSQGTLHPHPRPTKNPTRPSTPTNSHNPPRISTSTHTWTHTHTPTPQPKPVHNPNSHSVPTHNPTHTNTF